MNMVCSKNDVSIGKAAFNQDLFRFEIGISPIFLIFKKKLGLSWGSFFIYLISFQCSSLIFSEKILKPIFLFVYLFFVIFGWFKRKVEQISHISNIKNY